MIYNSKIKAKLHKMEGVQKQTLANTIHEWGGTLSYFSRNIYSFTF